MPYLPEIVRREQRDLLVLREQTERPAQQAKKAVQDSRVRQAQLALRVQRVYRAIPAQPDCKATPVPQGLQVLPACRERLVYKEIQEQLGSPAYRVIREGPNFKE